ncbi:hypothetical protein DSCO28_30340 [Desulfosarcina ovata subsp. sediminis]|uniref:Helix-turn-helix domain-containing protein n=1 Tax=Desulfosarcina ovata subsp. sediminis TaxID=885957 RepID=A0A5K7ZJQ5_9BACT|nr:helix-turn-helix domain-containing protein [Desulfosarcina ovata]BBO82468.1 hypothetical protein DSCO28_30340 [Desulfosarcina ovata subsp. sediminis]
MQLENCENQPGQIAHHLHPPLNETAAAEYLGVAVQTLRNWRHQRRGPAYVKLSPGPRGRIAYLFEDLSAYRQDCRVIPAER